MRDTGWVDGRREITFAPDHDAAFFLIVWPDSGWTLTASVETGGPSGASTESDRRAAEDALREMCRETLAALENP